MSGTPTRVLVAGAAGRMGTLACAALADAPGFRLAGQLERGDDLDAALASAQPDVLLDLTWIEASRVLVPRVARAGVRVVVGTSGWGEEDLTALRAAAREGGVGALVVPNFSIGAVLQMAACERAARALACTGIREVHHRDKRDAPSGTARATAARIARAAGGAAPSIASERRDDVVAIQEVAFAGEHERLVIAHEVVDRRAFVPGMLLAITAVGALTTVEVGLEHALGES